MKKYFIAFIICFASPFNLSAQLNLAWQSIIDDGASGNENAEISVNDPNGYVYTIGTMRPWGFNSSDLVIVKYDAMGNELWRTFYAGPSGKSEKINDAVLDQNGKFSRLLAHDLSGKELGKSGPPKTTKTAKTKSGGKKNVVKYFELCLMVNGVQVCKFYLLKE